MHQRRKGQTHLTPKLHNVREGRLNTGQERHTIEEARQHGCDDQVGRDVDAHDAVEGHEVQRQVDDEQEPVAQGRQYEVQRRVYDEQELVGATSASVLWHGAIGRQASCALHETRRTCTSSQMHLVGAR